MTMAHSPHQPPRDDDENNHTVLVPTSLNRSQLLEFERNDQTTVPRPVVKSEYPIDWESQKEQAAERANYTCGSCGARNDDPGVSLYAQYYADPSKIGRGLSNTILWCGECASDRHTASKTKFTRVTSTQDGVNVPLNNVSLDGFDDEEESIRSGVESASRTAADRAMWSINRLLNAGLNATTGLLSAGLSAIKMVGDTLLRLCYYPALLACALVGLLVLPATAITGMYTYAAVSLGVVLAGIGLAYAGNPKKWGTDTASETDSTESINRKDEHNPHTGEAKPEPEVNKSVEYVFETLVIQPKNNQ